MDPRRSQLLAMVDQDECEFRDVALETASDDAIRFYTDLLPQAWESDVRELVGSDLAETLCHIGLLQMAKWSAEMDADRVEGEKPA